MSDAVDLAFGEDGLVPAVAQDAGSGEVLMLAYASPEAVERTLATGEAHYHSRSRDELWHKGATSGHVQRVEEVRVDCDADALLYVVEQAGGACHTGHRSCFHRAVEGVEDGGGGASQSVDETPPAASDAREGGLRVDVEDVGEEVFDPDAVYE